MNWFAASRTTSSLQTSGPVSELDKQRAVVRATKETLTASVTGKKYSLPALSIALAARIADYTAAATDKHRPRPEVLKGLLATNDLSLASAAAYAHLEQSTDDPAIGSRLGPLQRAPQSGNSRRLYAGARSILRRMREVNVERQESLLAAVTNLSSAGLVLERERRGIRHFDGRALSEEERGDEFSASYKEAISGQPAPTSCDWRACRSSACCSALWLARLCDVAMDAGRDGSCAGRKRGTTDLGANRRGASTRQ
jgi:hypothetical protein